MKKLTVTTLLLFLMGISLGLSGPRTHQSRSHHQSSDFQSKEQLGLEITTNSCKQTLYLPVGMIKEKGLVATVPIDGGGAVSAVRIVPVMEKGKVKFDVFLVSGNYSETISSDELKQLPAVQVSTRVAANGETLVVGINGAPWVVNVKAVDLRKDSANAGENLQFLKASASQEPIGGEGCGCAYCHKLRVCPNAGQCISTTCGSICCPEG